MLAEERQARIAELVAREGRVSVAQLAAKFEVTDETIRRDIRYLAEKGAVRKVHGGATNTKMLEYGASLSERIRRQSEEKRRIGSFAMMQIHDGDIAYLPGIGSIVCSIENLRNISNLTVVTPSLEVASVVASAVHNRRIDGRIIMLGGEISPRHNSVYDQHFMEEINRFHFTKAFLGADALTEQGPSLSVLSPRISQLIDHTDTVYLLAESIKFEKTSLYCYAPYSDIDVLITDDVHLIPTNTQQCIVDNQVKLFRIGSDGLPLP